MKSKNLIIVTFLVILVLFFIWRSLSQQIPAINAVNRPQRVAFKQEFLSHLKLPQGFKVNVFAENVGKPRMLEVREDGAVYVTRPDEEDVILLRDTNSDGRADENLTIAKDIKLVHGITTHKGKLYLCGEKELYAGNLDGSNMKKLIGDLPDGGQHPRRTIGFGPDGMLYISIGSTCNTCIETNPEHATILRAGEDGSARKIFAKGLRNTIGFGWHPETKVIWGMDHGSDGRGDDLPPEELNQLEQGDYGWPHCFGKRQVDPQTQNPKGTTKEAYCAQTKGSTLEYQAHSAPIAMVFYTGQQFPAEYKNDAFIAMHGSWNRTTPTGFKVVRLKFEGGKPVSFQDFLTGFLVDGGKNQFGRPAGLAVLKDGSLLVSDDSNGVLYRISYQELSDKKK